MSEPDVLRWCEEELAAARAVASAAVDRAEALAELRSLLLERAAELGTATLTQDEALSGFVSERHRAHFAAVARRVATTQEETNAA